MTSTDFKPNFSASTDTITTNEADRLLAGLLTDLKVPTAANFSPVAEASAKASDSMKSIGLIEPKVSFKASSGAEMSENYEKAKQFVDARDELKQALQGLASALKPIADYQKVLDGDAAKITEGHTAVSAAMKKFSESVVEAKNRGLIDDSDMQIIEMKLQPVEGLVDAAKGEVTKVITTPERTVDYSSVPNLRFTSDWGIVEREKNKLDVIAKCMKNDVLEAKLERTGLRDYIKTEYNEHRAELGKAGDAEIKRLQEEGLAIANELKSDKEKLDALPKSFGEYLTKDGLLTGLWRGVKTIGSLGIFGYRSVAKERATLANDIKGFENLSDTNRAEIFRAEEAVADATTEAVTKGLSADLRGMKWIVDNTKEEAAVDFGEALLRQVSIPDGRTITHVDDLAEELKKRGFDVDNEAMTLKKGDHTLSFIRRTDGSVYMEVDGERQKGFLWTDKVEAVVSAFEADPKSVVMAKEPEQQTMVVQAVEKRVTA